MGLTPNHRNCNWIAKKEHFDWITSVLSIWIIEVNWSCFASVVFLTNDIGLGNRFFIFIDFLLCVWMQCFALLNILVFYRVIVNVISLFTWNVLVLYCQGLSLRVIKFGCWWTSDTYRLHSGLIESDRLLKINRLLTWLLLSSDDKYWLAATRNVCKTIHNCMF